MGYKHIENLYKNQTIVLFREVFANASGHLRVVEMLEGRVCVDGTAITHENA